MRNRALPYAWAFAVLALFALAACGGGKGPTGPDQGGPPPTFVLALRAGQAIEQRRPVTFNFEFNGCTPGGQVEFHERVPFGSSDCTDPNGCEIPSSLFPLMNCVNRSTPNGPQFASTGMSGNYAPGEYEIWGFDLGANRREYNHLKVRVLPDPQ